MPSISAQFSLLTLHLEVAWVYIRRQARSLSNYLFYCSTCGIVGTERVGTTVEIACL
jgi:hypothetical protein